MPPRKDEHDADVEKLNLMTLSASLKRSVTCARSKTLSYINHPTYQFQYPPSLTRSRLRYYKYNQKIGKPVQQQRDYHAGNPTFTKTFLDSDQVLTVGFQLEAQATLRLRLARVVV